VPNEYLTLFLLSSTTIIELFFAQRVKRRPEIFYGMAVLTLFGVFLTLRHII
jgi:hypothetical protein